MRPVIAFLCLFLCASTPLNDLYEKYEFVWTSDAATGREIITAEGMKIVFTPGMPMALVNGAAVRLSEPPRIVDGKLLLPPELVREIRRAPLREEAEPAQPVKVKPRVKPFPPFSIVIDPGHGGIHTGGRGVTGLLEKEVNLDVSKRLRRILEAAGVQVTMTRTTDTCFSKTIHKDLQRRCDVSNRAKPDVFLSIHANWVDDPDPRGFEVWVPKLAVGRRDRESRRLAGLIRTRLGRVFRSDDRGTKDSRNLYVLRNTRVPAALVELEFVSNEDAERQLRSDAVRQRLAQSLADALRAYITTRK